MITVDTLIHARWIIPVEPASVTLEHHSLAITKGRIVDILPTARARQQYHSDNIKELPSHALLPGLINCHTHAAMTLMRGIADDLPLQEWLTEHIWPLEQKWMNTAFVNDGTELAIAEMIRGGTTCFNDMYFFPDITAQQAIKHGIRASIGLIVIDFPTVWGEHAEDYIAKGLAVHEQYQPHELISTCFAPHAPYTVSDIPLQTIHAQAQRLGIPVHIHVHETLHEVDEARQQEGKRPLQRLHELGLVNPSLLAVHATQLMPEEIALLARQGAHLIHCPESNLKLASGFCPVARCLEAGVNVALGTDGAASNNDLDMFGEMRTAALLGKAVAQDASALAAMTVLRMATINGATALGLADEIGSLTIGKAADVIAINFDTLEAQPLYCPISHIVYATGRHQVSNVWIAGNHVLNDYRLTTFDLSALATQTQKWQALLSQ